MSKKFLPPAFQRVLREEIQKAGDLHRWHRARTASEVGVSLPTLRKYMRKFDLEPKSSRH